MKDPYSSLEISKNADQNEIKRAYRRLAKKYHPDSGSKNDQKFREVAEAYDLLKTPDKKAQYDAGQSTDYIRRENLNPDQSGVFDDIFDLFRNSRPEKPQKPYQHTMRQSLGLSFREAALGCQKTVRFQGRVININIPKGSKGGDCLRAKDILIELSVEEDSIFKLEGRDLLVEVPISLKEALLGSSITVPTLENPIRVKIKPLHELKTRLRIKGRGLPGRGISSKGAALNGDLIIDLKVIMPRNLSKDFLETLETMPDNGENLRKKLLKI